MTPNNARRQRVARRIGALAIAAVSVLAVDTSCTAPSHCSAGQHAQRAPSHQGHMWECAPDAGAPAATLTRADGEQVTPDAPQSAAPIAPDRTYRQA
jgi:hypothetical protein